MRPPMVGDRVRYCFPRDAIRFGEATILEVKGLLHYQGRQMKSVMVRWDKDGTQTPEFWEELELLQNGLEVMLDLLP